MLKRQLFIQEADEKLSRKENSHGRLVNYLEGNCSIKIWEHSSYASQNTAFEAMEYERRRLQNQESYLSQEILRRDSLHQQRVVLLQKQLGEACKQCQEETKSLSEERRCCEEKLTS